jgi:hypothetical protein
LWEIYKPQCREPLDNPEDLEALETLVDLEGPEDLVDLEGPEDLVDLLLLQPPQLPLQQHQQEMQTIDLWEAYPNPLKEIESLHETSSIN